MLGTSSTCTLKSLTLALLLAAPLAWPQSQSPGTAAPPAHERNDSSSPPEQPQPEQPAPGSQTRPGRKSAPFSIAAQSSSEQQEPRKPLNLYLGNAKELLSNTQWETLLASQPPPRDEFEYTEPEPAETVRVKASRPPVPSGIAGLFWALRHPSQAWRAFAPATSDEEEEEEEPQQEQAPAPRQR
jgi:hypothetical protein